MTNYTKSVIWPYISCISLSRHCNGCWWSPTWFWTRSVVLVWKVVGTVTLTREPVPFHSNLWWGVVDPTTKIHLKITKTCIEQQQLQLATSNAFWRLVFAPTSWCGCKYYIYTSDIHTSIRLSIPTLWGAGPSQDNVVINGNISPRFIPDHCLKNNLSE